MESYIELNNNSQHDLLVSELNYGNESALEQIYILLNRNIHNYAFSIVQNDFEACTIVQDAFMKMWDHRGKFQNMLHVLRFLRLVSRWQSMAYLRSKYFEFSKKISDLELDTNFIGNEKFEDDNDLIQKRSNMLDSIENVLKYLPEERAAMMKLYLTGYSIKELAIRHNRHFSYVSLILKDAFESLKRYLTPQKNEPNKNHIVLPPLENLTAIQADIYRRRIGHKQEFSFISEEMNLPLATVIQFYFESTQIIKIQENGRRKGFISSNP